MNLNIIDTTFIGIAVLFTLIILLDQDYLSAYITSTSYDESLPDILPLLSKTVVYIIVYLLLLFGWYVFKYKSKYLNITNVDTRFICITICYTVIALGYERYITYYKIKQHASLTMIQTIVNVFVYIGILIAWFYAKESQKDNKGNLLTSVGYILGGILATGILLYIGFEGLEYSMEKGIVSDQSQQHDATMSKKEYCPDFCSWFFTKNDCTTNKTWNGLTCVWNASKQLCSSPEKPKPWVRNIVRTLLVVFTIVVLILILALQKDIVNAIKPYPQLAWLLTIPNGILTILKKTKEDLKITTPMVWILIIIEFIVLCIYFFGNLFAHQAYHRHGILIHNPPLAINYESKIGCEALTELHTYEAVNTDDIDIHNQFSLKKGGLTKYLPIPKNTKNMSATAQRVVHFFNTKIPSKNYMISTDLIVHRDKSTRKAGNKNSVNYNYAISMWIYIDPHQPSKFDKWYSLFSFDSKPTLLYNSMLNSMLISVQENVTSTTTIEDSIKYSKPVNDIILQKWNHVFINNVGSKCDMFLNGELSSSIQNAIPQTKTNKITVGSPNGIVGKICNVYYFKKELNGTEILDIYHKYKNYDPPMAF